MLKFGAATADKPQQELCALHGKMRTLKSLMEDELGGWRCKPDCVCKVGGGTGLEGQGFCSVHNKNRSMDVLVEDGFGGFCCMGGKECKVGGQAPAAGPGAKRKKCTFFEVGKCQNGEDCPFLHEDWGASMPGKGKGKGGYDGKGYGSDPYGADVWSHADGDREAMLTYLATGMAVMVEKGKGKFGKGFAKLVEMKGLGKGFIDLDAGGKGNDGKDKGKGYSRPPEFGKGKPTNEIPGTFFCSLHKKMRSGSAMIDMGDGTFQCKASSECKSGPSPGGVKKQICKFFEQGTCTKGDACSYAHGEEELGMPVPDEQEEARFHPRGGGGKGARSSPY